MDVLIVGSGCREHALVWKLAQSPMLGRLYCAPGNAGIAAIAACVDIAAEDSAGLVGFAKDRGIGLVVVGPEAPLVAGLADDLAAAGILALGPGAAGAQLEGSKGFLKDLCAEAGIPTARYRRFHEAAPAKAFAATLGLPVVIKADGLAAGKGVVIATTAAEADAAIDAMLGGAFGAAGQELVIEEFLEGEEASFFVLTDGQTVLPMIGAQDHKRAFDGDTGPNTGGMGAYSPAPVLSDAVIAQTLTHIIQPTVAALRARGIAYRGVLYAGLMVTAEGPKLIEYNCRFGDPECQVLMMRLKSDLLPVLAACARGELAGHTLQWTSEAALSVVMAAKGYPGSYEKGSEIAGLDARGQVEGAQVFHAATQRHDGKLLAYGGRVLAVTALGHDVAAAQAKAYAAVNKIDWPGGFCRNDIGWRAIGRR